VVLDDARFGFMVEGTGVVAPRPDVTNWTSAVVATSRYFQAMALPKCASVLFKSRSRAARLPPFA
jgi:hypothetical protein